MAMGLGLWSPSYSVIGCYSGALSGQRGISPAQGLCCLEYSRWQSQHDKIFPLNWKEALNRQKNSMNSSRVSCNIFDVGNILWRYISFVFQGLKEAICQMLDLIPRSDHVRAWQPWNLIASVSDNLGMRLCERNYASYSKLFPPIIEIFLGTYT